MKKQKKALRFLFSVTVFILYFSIAQAQPQTEWTATMQSTNCVWMKVHTNPDISRVFAKSSFSLSMMDSCYSNTPIWTIPTTWSEKLPVEGRDLNNDGWNDPILMHLDINYPGYFFLRFRAVSGLNGNTLWQSFTDSISYNEEDWFEFFLIDDVTGDSCYDFVVSHEPQYRAKSFSIRNGTQNQLYFATDTTSYHAFGGIADFDNDSWLEFMDFSALTRFYRTQGHRNGVNNDNVNVDKQYPIGIVARFSFERR